MRTRFVAAVCAALVAGLGANIALAGEVKGPPTRGVPNENVTPATTRANSICAYSGLNDFIGGNGTNQTQTPAEGSPGVAGEACKGGSNFNRNWPN